MSAPVPDVADLLLGFERALLALDRQQGQRLLERARDSGNALTAIESVVAPALEQMGRAWDAGEIALSQVYMSGRLCEELVGKLLPEQPEGSEAQARIAMATLEDYHLLGKRIVLSALRASGFAVRDYGRATAEEVVERALEDGVEILLLSTLMLPSALRVARVRTLLSEKGAGTRVVVGGAPFRLDPRLGAEVGAYAVGTNTADAISIVRRLTGSAP